MHFREWQQRVEDILQSIASIQYRLSGITFKQFQADETLIKAVLYDFIIMGEAASNVPPNIQSRYPSVPWRLMSDQWNVIVYDYFQIKLESVWKTIRDDLPVLSFNLRDLLQQEKGMS